MYPVLFSIGALDVRASVVFLVLGILASILVGGREAIRVGISQQVFNLYWLALISLGLIFAALSGQIFRVKFLEALENLELALSRGYSSFGVILGALALGAIFEYFRKNSIGRALDLISLMLPLLLGIYRIGCLLNGCCYGLETDSIFGMYLPGEFGVWANRYPTQIILMIFNFGLFSYLWSRRQKKSFEGSLTLSYLILYSTGRLLIDFLRDLPHVLGPFSLHQLTAIAILLIAGFVAFEIRQEKVEAGM